MPDRAATLRPYQAADEAAAIELWRRTWQEAYPAIDFAARLDWWRERWRNELVPNTAVILAEVDGDLIGFITVEPVTGYIDQVVVAPQAWGSGVAAMLLEEAKRVSPARLDLSVNKDNARAIRFYRKHGFAVSGEDVNPLSGAPIYKMRWRP